MCKMFKNPLVFKTGHGLADGAVGANRISGRRPLAPSFGAAGAQCASAEGRVNILEETRYS